MKRSHEQFRNDRNSSLSGIGVAGTLRRLQNDDENDQPVDDWQLVTRKSKRPKNSTQTKVQPQLQDRTKQKSDKPQAKEDNRPALTVAPLHKLNSIIKISDLQNLALYCLADGFGPQWVSVRHHGQIRKAVVLMVPGLESAMFTGEIKLEESPPEREIDSVDVEASEQHDTQVATPSPPIVPSIEATHKTNHRNPDDFLPVTLAPDALPVSLKPLADMFSHVWPVKAPGDDRYCKLYSPLHAMLTAPIPKSQEEKKADKNSKGPKPVRSTGEWRNERTQIVEFLASTEELMDNDYVLHPACFETEEERAEYGKKRTAAKTADTDGWRDTVVTSLDEGSAPEAEIEKGSITAGRTVLSVDCEMCTVEGGESALTRVSIVAWDGEIVVDEYVKPDKPIINYLTPYSGVTAKSLEDITTSISDIQIKLLKLLHPRTVLIGHSLDSDLKALKITHPFIVDTSIIFPHPRGPPLKSSLKWLAQKYLSREIQKGHGTSGHNSIEDARTCLDLVKRKCEKGPKWGSSEASGESIFKRLVRTPKAGSSAPAGGAPREGKTGAIVDRGAPERNFGSMASFCVGCKDDAEIVDGIRRAVLGDPDGAYLPGGGVDFTWARMQELAILRGWLNDNRLVAATNTSTQPISPSQKPDPTPHELHTVVKATVDHIAAIWALLPPCTLFVVYSGTGDPREMARLQEMQRTFRREYAVKKWDELSVRWTDVEEQALRRACGKARRGLGFATVK